MKDMPASYEITGPSESFEITCLSPTYVGYCLAVSVTTSTKAASENVYVETRAETVVFNFKKPAIEFSAEMEQKKSDLNKLNLAGSGEIDKRATEIRRAEEERLKSLEWPNMGDAAKEVFRAYHSRLRDETAALNAERAPLSAEISEYTNASLTAAVEPLKAEFVVFLKSSGVKIEADQISVQGIDAPGSFIGLHVPASILDDSQIAQIHGQLGGEPVKPLAWVKWPGEFTSVSANGLNGPG